MRGVFQRCVKLKFRDEPDIYQWKKMASYRFSVQPTEWFIDGLSNSDRGLGHCHEYLGSWDAAGCSTRHLGLENCRRAPLLMESTELIDKQKSVKKHVESYFSLSLGIWHQTRCRGFLVPQIVTCKALSTSRYFIYMQSHFWLFYLLAGYHKDHDFCQLSCRPRHGLSRPRQNRCGPDIFESLLPGRRSPGAECQHWWISFGNMVGGKPQTMPYTSIHHYKRRWDVEW